MLPHRPTGAIPLSEGVTVDDIDIDTYMDIDDDIVASTSHGSGAESTMSAATSGYIDLNELVAREVGEGCLLLHRRLHRDPVLPRDPVDPMAARLMAVALRSVRAAALDGRHPGVRVSLLRSGSWLAGQSLRGAAAFVDDLRIATTVRTAQDCYRPMSAGEADLAESLLAPDLPTPRRDFSWSLLRQLHDELPILMDLDLDELRRRDVSGSTRAWIRDMLSSTSTHGAVKPGTTLRVVATHDPRRQVSVLQGHEHRVRALILQRPEQVKDVPSNLADWVQRLAFKQLEQRDLRMLACVVGRFPNLVNVGLPDLGRELVAENGERVELEEGEWIWRLKGRVDGVRGFDRLCRVWETDFAELRPFVARFGRMHRSELLSFLAELELGGDDDDTDSDGEVDDPAPTPTRIEQVTTLLVQAMKDDDLAIRCVFLSRESDELETRYDGMRLVADALARDPLSPLSSTMARDQDIVIPPQDWNEDRRLWSITAMLATAVARNCGLVVSEVNVGTLVRAIKHLPSELLTPAMVVRRDLALAMLASVQRQILIADLSHQDVAAVLVAAELSLVLGVTLRVDSEPDGGGATPRRVCPETLPAGAVAALRSIRQWVERGRLSGLERLQRERWFHHLVAITHDPAPRVLTGVFSGGAPGQTLLDLPPRAPLLKLMRALSRSLPLTLDASGVPERDRETVSRQLGERFFPIDISTTVRSAPSPVPSQDDRSIPMNSHLRTLKGPGARFMERASAAQLTRFVAAAQTIMPSLVALSIPATARTTIDAAHLASQADPPQNGAWMPQSDGRWIRQGFFQQMEAARAACWLVPDLVLQPERMTRLMDPERAGHAVLALIGEIGDGIRAINSKEIERRALPLARTVLSGAQEDEAFAARADAVIAEADGACLDARLSTLWELSSLREFGEIDTPAQAVDLALHLACRRRAEEAVTTTYPDFEEQVEEALLLKLAVTERLNERLRESQMRPTPEMAFASAGVNGPDWDSRPNRAAHRMWADRLIDEEIGEGLPLVRMELLSDAPGGPALTRVLSAAPAFRDAALARRLEMQGRYEQAMADARDDDAVTAANERLAEDDAQDRIEVLRHVERVREDLLTQLPHRLRSGAEVPFESSDHSSSSRRSWSSFSSSRSSSPA